VLPEAQGEGACGVRGINLRKQDGRSGRCRAPGAQGCVHARRWDGGRGGAGNGGAGNGGARNGGAQHMGVLPPDRGGSSVAAGPVQFWGTEGTVPSTIGSGARGAREDASDGAVGTERCGKPRGQGVKQPLHEGSA